MYTGFYELKQEPFHVTPDPEFLFPSPAHKEALAAIVYGIQQRKGFVAITGEVGVGKTTILRSYLELADRKNLKLIYIYNSNLTFDELLTTLFQELGVEDKPATTFMAVTRLHEELIEVYRRNATIVLIIDEAQNMPVETLESLRMLSNLETVAEKLIQIILIGQPEFEETLAQHRLRQLRQRIAIHARIEPLSVEDSLAYLQHRLNKVAIGARPVFTKQALRRIAEAANGIPRNLNIIADNALITGFGYQTRPVGAKIVREVLADRRLEAAAGRPRRSRWMAGAAAAVITIAVLVAVFGLAPRLMGGGTPLAHSNAGESRGTLTSSLENFGARVWNWASRAPERNPQSADRHERPPQSPRPRTALSGSAERTPPPEKPAAPAAAMSQPAEPAQRPLASNVPTPMPPRAPPPPPMQVSPSAPAPVTNVPPLPPPKANDLAALPPARDVSIPAIQPPSSRPENADRPVTTPPSRAPTPLTFAPPPPPAQAAVAPEPPRPSRSETTSGVRANHFVRTVRFGDSLWTMAEDVYGYVNPTILRRVQDANPRLRDINLLSPGQEILFPRIAEGTDVTIRASDQATRIQQ